MPPPQRENIRVCAFFEQPMPAIKTKKLNTLNVNFHVHNNSQLIRHACVAMCLGLYEK